MAQVTTERQPLREKSAEFLKLTASVVSKKGLASSSETKKLKKVVPVVKSEGQPRTGSSKIKYTETCSGQFHDNSSEKTPIVPSKQGTTKNKSNREKLQQNQLEAKSVGLNAIEASGKRKEKHSNRNRALNSIRKIHDDRKSSSSKSISAKNSATAVSSQQLETQYQCRKGRPQRSNIDRSIRVAQLSEAACELETRKKVLVRHQPEKCSFIKRTSSTLPVNSFESRSSGSRSKTCRLGFDGVIQSSSFTTSDNNSEQQLNSSVKQLEQRLTPGTDTSLMMDATVEDSRKNPSFQGFELPTQSSSSVNRNQSREDGNVDGAANIDLVGSNTRTALGNLYVAKYPAYEGIVKSPSVNDADNQLQSPCCTTRSKIIWSAIICCSFIATSVTIPCMLLLGGSSDSNYVLELSKVNRDAVVSRLSVDICNEYVPKSGNCTPLDSNLEQQGGELCNLVAKSMINTTVYADIALINAGICRDTLFAPELTAGNIQDAITMERLFVVEMPGIDIVEILNQAMKETFGETGNSQAYPYAAGLRYNVEANLPPSKRLSSIEVNRGLRNRVWEPIDTRRFYKVVTTELLANGGMGYVSFRNIINDWKIPLDIDTGDTFYDFAMKNTGTEWSLLPNSEYSTQYFIGENEDVAIATVPSRLCHALIPGKPESSFCNSADVLHGGDVCNLVSWAIYDQNFGVDLVLLNGDLCAGDIEEGDIVERSIDSILPENQSLVTFDLLGSEIVTMIVASISSALTNGMPGNYIYAAGLRFDVSSMSSQTVSNVQVLTSSGSWVPILGTATYSVATTPELAKSSSAQQMGTTIKEEIIEYAVDWKTLYKIPQDKVSTQSYV